MRLATSHSAVLRRLRRTLIPAVALLSAPWALAAQSMYSVVPDGHRLQVYAERRFDGASGLRGSTVFTLRLDRDGIPWLGADDGVYTYAGGIWRREPLPREFGHQQVRALLLPDDGSQWVGTRTGLLVRRPGEDWQVFREVNGLQGPVVFSLAESRAIDGTPRVVAGTSRGVSYFNGTRFVPLPLPVGIDPLAMMVAASQAPDGRPELWAASSVGGLARLHDGRWTLYGPAEGLATPDVQFVLPAGDSTARYVYASGSAGVFVLDRSQPGGGFTRLPDSPRNVFRLEVVDAGGTGPELWAGLMDGQVMRWAEGRWQPVETSITERHGAISMLEAVPGHGGGTAVYVSSRGGYLVRLSTGVAGGLVSPEVDAASWVSALLAESGADGRDELWVGTLGRGVLRVQGGARTTRLGFGARTASTTVTLLRRLSVAPPGVLEPAATDLVVVADSTPAVLRGDAFEWLDAGLGTTRVADVARVTLPDGRSALLAGTTDGVRLWTGARWEPLWRHVGGLVSAVSGGRVNGEPVVHLGGQGELHVVLRAGTRREALREAALTRGVGFVRRLCESPAGAVPRLFAVDTDRGILWRTVADSLWRPLPAPLTRVLSNLGVTDMTCLPNGRLAVSTFTGLAVFDVTAPTPDGWRVATQVSDADGLPVNGVTVLAPSGVASNIAWVGTTFGVGIVDLARAERLSPARLMVRVYSPSKRQPLSDGEGLAAGESDVRVDPMLLTYHREDLTRFRVQLGSETARGQAPTEAVLDSMDTEWLEAPSRHYNNLAPGRYLLTVWAYDWAGREYGPVRHRFTVPTPLWQTWPARLVYILSGLLLLAGFHRWRVRTIRGNAEQLLASERRARDAMREAEAERARFQDQVREAQKLESLGTLAGGVAHDFNNLLGVIRGNAELARTALRRGRSNHDNLGAILDASDRARDIVRQILTFSRRSTPSREVVNLSRLVLDLQPLLRRMIPRTVQLVIEGAEAAHLVMGDPTQLQQLLFNLVSNAEYAMRARTDGVLTIALHAHRVEPGGPSPVGDTVVLQVRDTGTGMSEEVRSRVFEPFFTTKPTGEGTGLGMAVVHGIVTSHGGRADVTSVVGEGTTFEVRFPQAVIEGLWDHELDADLLAEEATALPDPPGVIDTDGQAGHDDLAVLEDSPYAGTTIVVVDDEPTAASVVERLLQHFGHVVHVFNQPEAALQFIQQQPSAVDLLITDQTMPVMTGDLLAERVHALRRDLPVLILTGNSHRLTPERIAAVNAQAVMQKPVELGKLKLAVDAALATSRR